MCPANLTVQSLDGNATPVIYEPPSLIGGEPPITTNCVPKSGEIFLLGDSTVTCTATDAVRRTGSCSFVVTVVLPPKLSATKFMAFGNSITEGKNAVSQIVPNPYPAILMSMLAARYTAQTISVVNRGFGGEDTPTGSDRIEGELDVFHPEAVLVEEGINDIIFGDPSKVTQVAEGLRDIVRKAKARGVRVFLATLLPTRAGGTPPRGDHALTLVPQVNAQIRVLAQEEAVTLVDLYAGFGGSPDPYIDVDGLHPTAAGYQKIAEIFFDAIKANLEISPSVGPAGLVRNMPSSTMPFASIR